MLVPNEVENDQLLLDGCTLRVTPVELLRDSSLGRRELELGRERKGSAAPKPPIETEPNRLSIRLGPPNVLVNEEV